MRFVQTNPLIAFPVSVIMRYGQNTVFLSFKVGLHHRSTICRRSPDSWDFDPTPNWALPLDLTAMGNSGSLTNPRFPDSVSAPDMCQKF